MPLPAASHSRDLTDGQWVLIGPFLPKLGRRKDGRGRPWRENRPVFNGILWILRTGAPWADLPDRYPSYQTCHRRFQQWVRSGVWRSILEVLAQALLDEGYLDLQEAFIDGSFVPEKRGGASIGTTKRGKGSKIMAIADRQGLPVAVHVESATPHEVRLVHATLAERFVRQLPERLIGDNAYESDRLDAELARCGVELIAPHRRTRKRRTQDRRPLRRPTEVEGRATVCMAPELSADRRALRASRGELSRHATPCLQPHSLAGCMRWPLLQKHISATSSNSSNDECAPSKRWYAQILPSQKHDNLHCFRPCLPRSFMTYNTTLFAAARRQYLVEHQKH